MAHTQNYKTDCSKTAQSMLLHITFRSITFGKEQEEIITPADKEQGPQIQRHAPRDPSPPPGILCPFQQEASRAAF